MRMIISHNQVLVLRQVGYKKKRKCTRLQDSVLEGFAGSISYATSATLDKIYESRPTKASEYTNALRPISVAKYERLSDEEKKNISLPTNDEVMVLNKKAVEP